MTAREISEQLHHRFRFTYINTRGDVEDRTSPSAMLVRLPDSYDFLLASDFTRFFSFTRAMRSELYDRNRD